MSEAHVKFKRLSQELADLKSILNNLGWDQETMMPRKGGKYRARQLATLTSIHHQKLCDPEFRSLLDELSDCQLTPWDAASLREIRREVGKATRIPPELVRELAETASLAYQSWVEARQNSNFQTFEPWLRKMVGLKREQARCLATGSRLYDALIDDFEPHMTCSVLDPLFQELRPKLSALLAKIQESPKQPDPSLLRGRFPRKSQEAFGRKVLTEMGFDWEAGRLDISPHPFCSGFTPLDVRITTRYSEEDFSVAFFGIIHEGGHALYEQGLELEQFGMAACEPISLGIHESQSRLWEIFVARSRPFWTSWYPHLADVFPGQFDRVPLDHFVHAVNEVKPTLIRVDADEVTYGLHVILRYELEKSLIEGDLPIGDLERVWNTRMQEYLGIAPSKAAEGVLQDVHWSHGLVGYFPTYLLGTVYAAQFFHRAIRDVPDLRNEIEEGTLLPLRDWLRERIHRPGRTVSADQLVRSVTGEPLKSEYFLSHLESKYGELYEL